MTVKDKLKTKLRIFLITSGSRATLDWLEVHGFLTKTWRDPRVQVLCTVANLVDHGVTERGDYEFVFLDGWTGRCSPDFRQKLWALIPGVMAKVRVR